jgi:hypothetical protein
MDQYTQRKMPPHPNPPPLGGRGFRDIKNGKSI